MFVYLDVAEQKYINKIQELSNFLVFMKPKNLQRYLNNVTATNDFSTVKQPVRWLQDVTGVIPIIEAVQNILRDPIVTSA